MHLKLPFNKTLIIRGPKFKLIPTRKIRTLGIHSRCADGLHVIFLDYDEIDKTTVIQDLQCLQQSFFLSDFHLFATKKEEKIMVNGIEQTIGSYHAICLDKFTLYEANLILMRSHADAAFKRGSYLNTARAWTLRTHEDYRPKPVFIGTVESPFAEHQQSSAHAEFLRKHYGVPIKLSNPDNLEWMWFEEYNTKVKKGDAENG